MKLIHKITMNSLIKLALLFLTTLTLFACGGSSGGGSDAPAPTATPAPVITKLTIANAQAGEGENIIFTVTATPNIAKAISFNYRINFDNPITSTSAQANDLSGDFSGTKTSTIDANKTSTTISIPIVNDTFKEKAETFRIVLSNLAPTTDATFTNNKAIGTIESSDPDKVKTILSIVDSQAGEGENITFTVTSAFAIAEQISFKYRIDFDNPLTPDSASPADLSGQLTGTSTIDINTTSTTFSIATVNDSLREKAESFSVILSDLSPSDATFAVDNIGRGTIMDNDETGIVTISVADATANEDSGTINFQVTSNFNHSQAVTFGYEVVLDNSANANDFDDATNGTATISAANSSTMVAISIATDGTLEPNEIFSLRLTNTSSNATLDSANNSAMGTILNDDVSNVSNATAMLGDTSITLSWTNPDSNLFAGVRIAETTGSTAPAENCSSGTTTDIVNATSRNITGLTTGTTHSFRICARSTSGSLSSGVPLANLTPSEIIDNNNNGLIEIADATALFNIRHNLAGTGYKASSDAPSFTRGCPNNVCIGYELMNDIDLSSFNDGTWDPIGSNSDNDKFTAIFDGTDNRINGLRITSGNYIGLFAAIENATIRNLELATVAIAGGGNVGALVGAATNSTLSNIELIGGSITTNLSNVGGLVGSFSGSITDSSSNLTLNNTSNTNNISVDNTGGLVGHLTAGSIKNSNSSGSVTTTVVDARFPINYTGGLVGQTNSETTISNSWASGNVTSNGSGNLYFGGLVGQNAGNISNSWASGSNVANFQNGSPVRGGLVGGNAGTISNSWASGNVSTNFENNGYGGLVGENTGTISNSWASGNASNSVNGGERVGGLVGFNNSGAIQGRNYQLDNSIGTNSFIDLDLANNDGEGVSFVLGDGVGNDATGLRALEMLSGDATNEDTTSDWQMNSGWHTGFDLDNADNDASSSTGIDLKTRFCDTNGNGIIDLGNVVGNPDERTANNTVWVMAGADSANNLPAAPTTAEDGVTARAYYAIPALRCIANTAGITDQTEIDAMRKIEIDRQRRLFAK